MGSLDITYGRHATERSGHWYTSDGRLVELVPNAKGDKLIKPDIRHARKLDLAPGVTTICGMADRPDLTEWQITQAIMSALTLTRAPGETDMDFLVRVRRDSKEHAAKAAEKGTAIHASMQEHYTDGFVSNAEHLAHVEAVRSVISATCGEQRWHPEKPCVSAYGYATKADLISDEWLLDFKTKDGDIDRLLAMTPYESYVMQLAATDRAAGGECFRRFGVVYASRDNPEAACLHEVPSRDVILGWEKFKCLLKLWQLRTGYRPSWATMEV